MSEMLQPVEIMSAEHEVHIRNLFSEYAQWLQEKAKQEYEVSVNGDEKLQLFMKGWDVFYPPRGRMYLSRVGNEIAGIGCLKPLDNNVGEIKRMFVKSEYRGKGLGKLILDQLIMDARSIGYTTIRLDSPKFSIAAHRLYQSMGFQFIGPYPGSDSAQTQPDLVVYMELVL